MPFGLVNAPATFQCLMEVVLADLARNACLVYLDDILVVGNSLEQHNDNLKKVFTRIRQAWLKLKPKKCSFTQQKVKYLGHVVSEEGIYTDSKKDAMFVWSAQCQRAFEQLKSLLTSAPVLAFPNFANPFILETDASGTGLGAVLAQKQTNGTVQLVAYASKSLQTHEKNYGITELEGLGLSGP